MPGYKNTVTIVGAGIAGLASALLLSRQGYQINLYDKRHVFTQEVDGRSINFTISGRGLAVLDQLGLKEKVLAQSAVLEGRLMHLANLTQVSYKYGTKKSQVLLAIRRSKLINILLNELNKQNNIAFYPGFELVDLERNKAICHFLNIGTEKIITVEADWIIGADGVFSNVRNLILKQQITSYEQTVFNWGYKEYQFTQEDAQKLHLSTNQMHMWPKAEALLVAIPNIDQSFSVIFTAPLQNKQAKLNHFDELVCAEFPDIIAQMPSFLTRSTPHPHHYLVSIKIDKWHWEDKVVLVGDASHATYPFFGQGMNSALEDAILLNRYVNESALNRLDAFAEYERHRKKDTNALHRLSESHLQQMTKSMISPFWQARDIVDYQLARWSSKWVYAYEMLAHSTISYSQVLKLIQKQNRKKLMSGFFIVASLLGCILHTKNAVQNLKFKRRRSG